MLARASYTYIGLSLSMLLAPYNLGWAQLADRDEVERDPRLQFESSLSWQTGDIPLPNGIATLNLSKSFRYLGPQDAQRVLVDAWGNPPGGESLGMVFPARLNPTDDNAWGVIISFTGDGHVSDSDAESINYDELLKDLQERAQSANDERTQQGYGSVNLVGWAERPTYDNVAKKMYWAKEIAFSDTPENTLNYDVRILGREGVLVMQAIAGMSQLDQVKPGMDELLTMTEFNAGQRYADFDPAIDKTAAYGLAALVAGGVAAKMGLFAKLFALLIAFKKIIFVVVAGLFMLVVRLVRRKPSNT